MKLLSLRTAKRGGAWITMWYIDGVFFSVGLCPCDGRETPPGVYPVRLVMSDKFSGDFGGQPMPWIDSSPETDDYTKVKQGEHRLIHWGNILEHTDGCELVGQSHLNPFFLLRPRGQFLAYNVGRANVPL